MRMLISLPLRGRGRLRPGPGGSTRERDMAARAPGGGHPGLDGTAARHLRAAVHPPLRPHVTPGKTGGWWQRTEPFWCLKDGGGGDRQLTADRYLRPLSRSAVRCGGGRRLRTASRLSAGWRGLRQSIRRFSSRLAWARCPGLPATPKMPSRLAAASSARTSARRSPAAWPASRIVGVSHQNAASVTRATSAALSRRLLPAAAAVGLPGAMP